MPAPIVNGGGDRFWKWKEFKLSRARDLDLDLGSGHTAYSRASLIDLYLYTKFHWNRRNFLWTDGRTYGRADIFPPLILLGRLLEVDLIKKVCGPYEDSNPWSYKSAQLFISAVNQQHYLPSEHVNGNNSLSTASPYPSFFITCFNQDNMHLKFETQCIWNLRRNRFYKIKTMTAFD